MQDVQLTIVIPAYNASKYISKTIGAIVAQTFTAWKLIIVNDCSQDDTKVIVEEWTKKDNRIHLVTNEQNLKVARSMNKGIGLVDTPFFARVDSDDIPLPHHFEKIINLLNANSGIAICGSQIITIDENGAFRRKWNYETDPDWIRMYAVFACPFLQSSVVMRTEAIKDLGGYRPEKELVEDYELWIRALQKYNAANIPDYTIQYRIHAANMSETNKGKILQMLQTLYMDNKDFYPVDTTHLALHARMEFGDWSALQGSEMSAMDRWRKQLETINSQKKFYPSDQYKQVLLKYFTNAYLKIATQNGGAMRLKALYKAFATSPVYFKEIWKRKKENAVNPIDH